MTDLITIASDELTARINPLGAELWSLTDRQGREYMTDADPAFWTGHAPLLFPIVGALNGGRYRLGDAEYALPKHGFARHSGFGLISQTDSTLWLQLADSEETRAVYPFAFLLDMIFALDGPALRMTAKVTNCGDAPMPFSFGFHPAFAWPLPGASPEMPHVVEFQHNEPFSVRRLDAAGLVAGEVESPVLGNTLILSRDLFENDALIWDDLFSGWADYGSQTGAPRLRLDFPDTSMLGIWQKPGARYICIEPWQGIADPVAFHGDFREKPGVITLSPGDTRSFRMDVTVRPAPSTSSG